jgi:hypothetical protein
MSSLESLEIKKAKIDSLVAGFFKTGYKSTSNINQSELIQFLNRRSSSGKFDPIISGKLFEVLSLDAMSTITVEEFINGFLQFEEEIQKNAEDFSIKLSKEEEIFSQIENDFKKYKESLTADGLCENAKVSGEITEIDIQKKLEGIKEIIIKIIYNEKNEELHFKMGDISSNELEHKTFEFKPTSRKDHFEFIMKGINDRNQEFDIGKKIFDLSNINSHEEYLVQIVVPEIDNEEIIAAFIKAKIVVFWSDYKMYEKQKKKAENKLKKLTIAKNKAEEYLKKIREIYGDLVKKQPDLIVDFNNEKLMQRKGAKLNVNFNNTKEVEAPGSNYVVEFNNQKEVLIKQEVKTETKIVESNEKKIEPPVPVQENVENVENVEQNNVQENAEIINTEGEDQNNNYENNYENIENYEYEQGVETNYENYENIPGEIVGETEIRNSIQDAVIRQSLNKPLIQENTLPVIRQEKVNEVIYDTNVTTLPVIFGGKKVTYLNQEESKNFDFNSLIQQSGVQEIYQTENYTQNYQDITQGQQQDFTFGEYESTQY